MPARTLDSLPLLACVAMAVAMGGCSRPANEASLSVEQVQSLLNRVQYLEDIAAIQKLQSSYVHRLFTQRYESIPDLYAKNSPDFTVEFSDSGLFKGSACSMEMQVLFSSTSFSTVIRALEDSVSRRTMREPVIWTSSSVSPASAGSAAAADKEKPAQTAVATAI